MALERPDLSGLSPEILAYIESLEAEITRLQAKKRPGSAEEDLPPLEPDEAPTPINIITLSAKGMIKRTPRHLYSRQRRGGMGVFDIDIPADDQPAILSAVDETGYLFCLTTQARTFRLKVDRLPAKPVRSKGQAIHSLLPLHQDEQIAALLPERDDGYIVILTERGHVRRYRHHYFGKNLKDGLVLFELKELGQPTAACWSAGEADLFVGTEAGKGIRFAERQVPVRGCLGIRLTPGDRAVAIASVDDKTNLFLAGDNGKGTIRQMSGFSPNKSPGSGGKVAFKTDKLIGALPVTDDDDIFIISKLGKLIRFQAVETPPKEGVVQGVNCMALRSDACTAMINSA